METAFDNEEILRGAVCVSWVLYALTFIPFSAEYLIQLVFAAIAGLGLVVALLSIFRVRLWKLAATLVAIVLLLVYVDYWASITEMARSSKPELPSSLALGHVVRQAWTIVTHHLSSGAILGALKVAYFELAMPLVQLVLLVAFLSQRLLSHSSNRSVT